MLSAQSNYHLTNKDSATVEFVSNMLQNEASNYLSNMNTLSHVSKMCSSLSAHWPTSISSQPQNQMPQMSQSSAAAAAAAALAAGHNIESILGGYNSVKIDTEKNLAQYKSNPQTSSYEHGKIDYSNKTNSFNNSYDGKKRSFINNQLIL